MPGICGVCGNPKGVFRYYGANVCASCKVFFLRAVTSKKDEDYQCEKDGKCEITNEKWTKNCRACRYAKCLEVKMDPSAVGTVARLKSGEVTEFLPSRHRDDREEEECLPDEPMIVQYFKRGLRRPTESMVMSRAVGLNFVKSLQRSGGAMQFAASLCLLESKCYGDDLSIQLDDDIFIGQNMEVPLHRAFQEPLLLSRRTPMDWSNNRKLCSTMLDTIKKIYCRQTVHYLDWLSGSPDIYLLNEKDRMNLIGAQLCHVLLMMMMYHTYKTGAPGIAFSSGYHYIMTPRGEEPPTEFDSFLDELARYGHEHIITMFRRLDITKEEYILLKTIGFYSCPMQLSEAGMEVVRRARQKHEQILVAYVDERYPDMSVTERSNRVQDIVSLNKHFAKMAIFDNTYVCRMITMNMGEMRCELTYDMHLKQH